MSDDEAPFGRRYVRCPRCGHDYDPRALWVRLEREVCYVCDPWQGNAPFRGDGRVVRGCVFGAFDRLVAAGHVVEAERHALYPVLEDVYARLPDKTPGPAGAGLPERIVDGWLAEGSPHAWTPRLAKNPTLF